MIVNPVLSKSGKGLNSILKTQTEKLIKHMSQSASQETYPAWQRFFSPSKEKEKKPLHGSA